MPKFKKLATLAAAAAAAASYAKKNPEQSAKFVDQAAQFVDKQTKGKYSSHISGATDRSGPAGSFPVGSSPAGPVRPRSSRPHGTGRCASFRTGSGWGCWASYRRRSLRAGSRWPRTRRAAG